MKKNCEEHVQIYVVEYLNKLRLSGADFMFWHTPNGGHRSKSEACKMKMIGVMPGVPDLTIMHSGGVFFVELKKRTGGRLSKEQKDFQSAALSYNMAYHILYADTIEEGRAAIAEIMTHHGISSSRNGVKLNDGSA
jgi:hypothetical protein